MRSQVGFETACAIILSKLRNCEYILTRYVARRNRVGAADARELRTIQNTLARLRAEILRFASVRELMLVEARSGRAYWRAVALLCRVGKWRREHRASLDPLNRYLSIGYHLLTLECEKALIEAGLHLEAGLLHGEHSGKPLLYDFMETFRQPAVDYVVIPFFSRKRKGAVSERDRARFLGRLKQRFDSRFPFRGRCESLRRIIRLEAATLKNAVLEGRAYQPYHHRWGNSGSC